MHELKDNELLAQYAGSQSERAFAALVSRHIDMVYSAALRIVGDSHEAEDITQVAFILLAKKAGSLPPKTILSGWLYRTARLTAANYLRMKSRRKHREQEAYMQLSVNRPEPEAWMQIAPLLETAMEHLADRERNAVILRFFEAKSLKEVGQALSATENTAQKCIERALKKLRSFFMRRGIALSAATLAGVLSANSVQAAPAALTQSTVMAGISQSATVSGPSLLLLKSTLKTMTWLKVKMVMAASISAVLIAGSVTVAVVQIQKVMAKRDQPSEIAKGAAAPLDHVPKTPVLGKQSSADPTIAMPGDRGTSDADSAGDNSPNIQGASTNLDDASTYIQRGRFYLSKNDLDPAIANYNQALLINPKAAPAYFGRGRAYKLQGQYEQAIADFNQTITLNPDAVWAYVNRGEVYNLVGDCDQAVTDFNEAVQLDPQRTLAFVGRGASYLFKGDYDQAIADCNAALQLDPRNVMAYANRGRAYSLEGNFDKAIANDDQALEIIPNSANIYNSRGATYELKGEYDKAVADYKLALSIAPDFSQADNNLAWLLATCPQANFRDGSKAVAIATKACELSRWNNLNQIDTLAAAYAEAGDFNNAMKWESKIAETPNLAQEDLATAQKRLALYQAHQAYHRYAGDESSEGSH